MYYRYTIVSLQELLEAVRASEQGLSACAQAARSEQLRAIFRAQASRRARAACELAELIDQLGGAPELTVGNFRVRRRGWLDLHTFTAEDDDRLIDACERGEDHALEVYRNALDDHLPELVRQVVLRQFELTMSDHNEIRLLRSDVLRSGIVGVSVGGDAWQ